MPRRIAPHHPAVPPLPGTAPSPTCRPGVEVRQVLQAWATSCEHSEQTRTRMSETVTRFARHASARGVRRLSEVSAADARAFITAPTRHGQEPELATQHARRTALRTLYRTARLLDLAHRRPDAGRRAAAARMPGGPAAERRRGHPVPRLDRARPAVLGASLRATAWALGEATAISSEITAVRIRDLDDPVASAPRPTARHPAPRPPPGEPDRLGRDHPGRARQRPAAASTAPTRCWPTAATPRREARRRRRACATRCGTSWAPPGCSRVRHPARLAAPLGRAIRLRRRHTARRRRAAAGSALPRRHRRGHRPGLAAATPSAATRSSPAGRNRLRRPTARTAARARPNRRPQPCHRPGGLEVTRLHVVRTQVLTTAEQIEAVFSQPTLYRLAAEVPYRQPVGRPPLHPAWALLGYGVLARRVPLRRPHRSRARQPRGLAAHPRDRRPSARRTTPTSTSRPATRHRPPDWAAWKNARNRYFTDPEILPRLQEVFTEAAVEQARAFGLLDPRGDGSLCHPSPVPRGLRRRHRHPTPVPATGSQAHQGPRDRRGHHHLPRHRRHPHRGATAPLRPRRRRLPRPHRLGARPELRRPLRPRRPTHTNASSSPSTGSPAPAWRPTPRWPASNASTHCSATASKPSSTTAPCAAPTSTT